MANVILSEAVAKPRCGEANAKSTYQLSPSDRLHLVQQAPSWTAGPGRSLIAGAAIEVMRGRFFRANGHDGLNQLNPTTGVQDEY